MQKKNQNELVSISIFVFQVFIIKNTYVMVLRA